MTKQLENKISALAYSEYMPALEEYLLELVKENDLANRAIDPHKEPHTFSKRVGGSEGYLMLIQNLNSMRVEENLQS